ncbi:tRNA (adenosine(37)-N6)-threonylcarbamoyltransferase complex dimerization subunit type 1 TsaB [Winogradskyella jejuensis]|uniref:tRNA threonylcarbamoyladenosine biosynthesis protein TsaB n=1 Tax=Winogradskyella jejuensis TaxID=1089305 RepID=A0A1M5LSM3_9FLAO|nr:tRNA (adenosine(37)-N6)-threonylcarbamoyltransferase complex dimerization subunit type 1 TsaB [Winogradskyella jejuensis]SHG67986.1 tRNA threonylcarbamoyladenosine biosynthesis protein TsaB [Winogradskyella jejuensis]
MALILNIETSTTNCSVSLSKDEEILVLKEDNNAGYSHAEKLHLFIKEVIDESGVSKSNLDAVAISKGPGSYTGLRIGVSTVKGLCFSLDKPLISVSTLEALAHQVYIDDGLIIPMLDARRMEVYSAIIDSDYNLVRGIEAQILDSHSFNTELENGKVHFIGNGVEKTKEIITHSNAVFIDGNLPSASTMGKIANDKYKISDFENVAYFEPYYLKDFVAIKSKKI